MAATDTLREQDALRELRDLLDRHLRELAPRSPLRGAWLACRRELGPMTGEPTLALIPSTGPARSPSVPARAHEGREPRR